MHSRCPGISFSFFVLFCFTSCASFEVFEKEKSFLTAHSEEPDHELYVMGGMTDIIDRTQLKKQLINSGEKSSFILLGNTVLKSSFPDTSKTRIREKAETRLKNVTGFMKEYEGRVVITPGYNEWSKGKKIGRNRLNNLEGWVENNLGDGKNEKNIFLPDNGCPGPVEINISEDLVLLIIDTQWLLNEWSVIPEENLCGIASKTDFILALDEAIKRNYQKKIVVAGHHALYSNGPANGYFPAKTHWIPPVLGSLYVLYKRYIGDVQDISNPTYKINRGILNSIFRKHKNLVYLSASEESLQYFQKAGVNYVVAGSGSNATAVASGNEATYAAPQTGFAKLKNYNSGELRLEFWNFDNQETPIWSTVLIKEPPNFEEETDSREISYKGESVTALATTKLHKKRMKRGLSGLNYRATWEQQIDSIPVFDIKSEKGGLDIVKKGGGQQTISLRLEGKKERQYVLRSIEKFPEKAVPVELRGTVVADIVSDQVSASHPYGAFVIPKMAEAAQIYHTNPKLVYIPDDPRLGRFREDFANGLYLFEERPAKNRSDVESFGNSKKIISTADLIEKLRKNGKHTVDKDFAVRSRIFDILIGDWDRHDDQWRWAKFEVNTAYDKGHNLYRPIPRDRDQAFFRGDGLLLSLFSRKWGVPKFQGFERRIRDVSGLEFNARHFDRHFLTEAAWKDWEKATRLIQNNVTNDVINRALSDWPEEIYKLDGVPIKIKLSQRRNDLMKYAREHYLFLSKAVNILGTDEQDRFEVKRLSDLETKVTVFEVTSKKRKVKRKYYERIFRTDETKEIRLYGFRKDDEFYISGHVNKGIKIRCIGGTGEDIFADSGSVAGMLKNTIVYDNKSGTEISGKEVRNRTSDKREGINTFDRYAFKYDLLAPNFFFGYNPDDLLFVGGGVTFTKHGFRKIPYSQKHSLKINVAPASANYNVVYRNEIMQLFGSLDLITELDVNQPSFADFFYGWGNGTQIDEDKRDEDRQFYRARYSQVRYFNGLRKQWNEGVHKLTFGGFFRRLNIEADENNEEPDRFIFEYAAFRELAGFELFDQPRNFAGPYLFYELDNTKGKLAPKRGFKYDFLVVNNQQIGGEDSLDYTNLSANLTYYLTLGPGQRFTIASRLGGSVNFGDFEFFQAPRLGGLQTLRGYRRNRFAGQQAVYINNDFRFKLFDIRSKVLVAPVGLLALADFGRVWANDIPGNIGKEKWHKGVGGGIWAIPFNATVISVDFSKSLTEEDESAIFLRFGFMF
jgi:hypothetical protein